MDSAEIIKLLGGVTEVARLLAIKPPSVHAWLTAGIPEYRLIELAAYLEAKSGGSFSRRARWPERYKFIWPELADGHTPDAPQTPAGAEQGVANA